MRQRSHTLRRSSRRLDVESRARRPMAFCAALAFVALSTGCSWTTLAFHGDTFQPTCITPRTQVRVRLERAIDPIAARRGDPFVAFTEHAVTDGSGRRMIPELARVWGHVAGVYRYSEATLELAAERVETTRGIAPLDGSAMSLGHASKPIDITVRSSIDPLGARSPVCPPTVEVPAGTPIALRLVSPIDNDDTAAGRPSTVAMTVLSPLFTTRGELLVSAGAQLTARIQRAPSSGPSALSLELWSIETRLGTVPLEARARDGFDGYASLEAPPGGVPHVVLAPPKPTRGEAHDAPTTRIQIPGGAELSVVLTRALRVPTPAL